MLHICVIYIDICGEIFNECILGEQRKIEILNIVIYVVYISHMCDKLANNRLLQVCLHSS